MVWFMVICLDIVVCNELVVYEFVSCVIEVWGGKVDVLMFDILVVV